MKTIAFIAITLFSGAIAGTLFGLINQLVVEPYIDKAIEIQRQKAINSGQIIDPTLQPNYRMWQKTGEIVAGTVYGISLSALFGVIYAYGRNSRLLPGSNNQKKALVLAGIMFFVLFLVPALKYPANPPGVGNPETIYDREILYVGFTAISGFTTLALVLLFTTRTVVNSNNMHSGLRKRIVIPVLLYAVIMTTTYLLFPPNPDKITISMDLITTFRIAGAFTVGIFWGLMGITLGSFWDKFKPHEPTKISTI